MDSAYARRKGRFGFRSREERIFPMFQSANKEAAWKFMQFMTSPYAQEEMANAPDPRKRRGSGKRYGKRGLILRLHHAIKTAKSRSP